MDSKQPERQFDALASFVVPAPEGAGEQIPVRTATATVGQSPQNEIVLDDDTVSSKHARLELVTGSWRITDLESKNGTFVEGIRLAPGIPTPLPTATRVAFGAMELDFLTHEGADPEAAAARRTNLGTDKPSLAERKAFRVPVWLVAVILLFIALLVTLYIVFSGDPLPAEQVTQPATAYLTAISYRPAG